jgi:hypothetical protein
MLHLLVVGLNVNGCVIPTADLVDDLQYPHAQLRNMLQQTGCNVKVAPTKGDGTKGEGYIGELKAPIQFPDPRRIKR